MKMSKYRDKRNKDDSLCGKKYRSAAINNYMRGIYLCALCESLPDRIIK